jgi:hypothetical protein
VEDEGRLPGARENITSWDKFQWFIRPQLTVKKSCSVLYLDIDKLLKYNPPGNFPSQKLKLIASNTLTIKLNIKKRRRKSILKNGRLEFPPSASAGGPSTPSSKKIRNEVFGKKLYKKKQLALMLDSRRGRDEILTR